VQVPGVFFIGGIHACPEVQNRLDLGDFDCEDFLDRGAAGMRSAYACVCLSPEDRRWGCPCGDL
jgi:hypothetical protein